MVTAAAAAAAFEGSTISPALLVLSLSDTSLRLSIEISLLDVEGSWLLGLFESTLPLTIDEEEVDGLYGLDAFGAFASEEPIISMSYSSERSYVDDIGSISCFSFATNGLPTVAFLLFSDQNILLHIATRMPTIGVHVKADLENVSLSMTPEFLFRVVFRCDTCNEVSAKAQPFGWSADEPIPEGKGTAQIVAKCKGCKGAYYASVVSDPSLAVYPIEASGVWKQIALIEWRGACRPDSIEPGSGWTATDPSGAAYKDLNMAEDFAEFDEVSSASVSVMDFKIKVEAGEEMKRVKKVTAEGGGGSA